MANESVMVEHGTKPAPPDPIPKLFPEARVVNFLHRQDQLLLFSMINELIRPHHTVVDFGAGRGYWSEIGGVHLRSLSRLKGRVARTIGVDVDPVVLQNREIDEGFVIAADGKIPLPDASVDLIYSLYVFEHIADPERAAAELTRILKPGGWICACTPNKWGYVGIGARAVPNALHARLLEIVAPGGRREVDIFPTRYRMNTRGTIAKHFPPTRFENYTFCFNSQPSYHFGSVLVARFWLAYMALMPPGGRKDLFVFLKKK